MTAIGAKTVSELVLDAMYPGGLAPVATDPDDPSTAGLPSTPVLWELFGDLDDDLLGGL